MSAINQNRNRVVVTGLGAVTPLGSTVERFWEGLLSGVSGIRRITHFDASDLPCQIAGEIPDFNPEDYLERKEARRIPRSAQIAVAAADQAVRHAGLEIPLSEPERCGVVFGTAIGGLDRFDEGIKTLRSQGLSRVNPFTVPSGIPNLSAFMISYQFNCLGRNITITTACATGTQAIGEATELIRRGVSDIVITGGTEAIITDFSIAGFCAMRALPTNFNQNPQAASRPFDIRREGFIFSEGSAALVLESLEHAQARNVPILAEIGGHASSTDAFHMAAPDPEASGPTRAMQWALEDSGLTASEIDYINAHGTSTPLNDPTETKAIKNVFGEYAYSIPISSTKSMLGHAMGASGALEALVCILAIQNHWLPPTINYEEPDPACDLDYVPNIKRYHPVKATLSNSFGLGGQNACLVLKKFEE